MSIHKLTATDIRNMDKVYVTLLYDTVQMVNDAVALGVLTYLLSKPKDWITMKLDIQIHFNLGRDSVTKAIRFLKQLGFIRDTIHRDSTGKITGKTFEVYGYPVQPESSPSDGLPVRLENRPTEKPSDGFPVRIDNNRINTKEEIRRKEEKPQKKMQTYFPEDRFAVNQGNKDLAKRLSIHLDDLFVEQFRDWHEARGNKFVNWNAALNNWIRKAAEFRGPILTPSSAYPPTRDLRREREEAKKNGGR